MSFIDQRRSSWEGEGCGGGGEAAGVVGATGAAYDQLGSPQWSPQVSKGARWLRAQRDAERIGVHKGMGGEGGEQPAHARQI